jgi:hypothetical protein
MKYAMVLNDGETWTGLHGCAIVAIPDEVDDSEQDEFIKDALAENTPSVIRRF